MGQEMAQQLTALVALAKDLDFIPSTHTVAHNLCHSSFRGPMPSANLYQYQACHVHTCARKQHTPHK